MIYFYNKFYIFILYFILAALKYIDDDLKQIDENKQNVIHKEKRRDCNDNCNIL